MKNGFVGAIAVIAILFAGWATYPYWTRSQTEVIVTHVENKLTPGRSDRKDVYLVYTTSGTFRNTDSLHYLKFNSSDVQGLLAQEGRFRVTTYGFRVPMLSMYRNIVKAEKLP